MKPASLVATAALALAGPVLAEATDGISEAWKAVERMRRAADFIAERHAFTDDEAEAVKHCIAERADRERWPLDITEVEYAVLIERAVDPYRSPDAPEELRTYGEIGFCVRSEIVRIEARRAGLRDRRTPFVFELEPPAD